MSGVAVVVLRPSGMMLMMRFGYDVLWIENVVRMDDLLLLASCTLGTMISQPIYIMYTVIKLEIHISNNVYNCIGRLLPLT